MCNGVAGQAGSASPTTLMTPQNSLPVKQCVALGCGVKGERKKKKLDHKDSHSTASKGLWRLLPAWRALAALFRERRVG